MRQRIAKEDSITKVMFFLDDLKLFCEGKSNIKTVTMLHEIHQVSRSTASACKKLEITRQNENGLVWLANEPTRQMALMILNLNLERSPGVMKANQIDGFGDLLSSVKALTDAMNTVATQNERSIRGTKIASNPVPDNSHNLFTEEDQYKADYFDLVKSIASGLYANSSTDLMLYQQVNDLAVNAARDLMDKAFSK